MIFTKNKDENFVEQKELVLMAQGARNKSVGTKPFWKHNAFDSILIGSIVGRFRRLAFTLII